MNCSEFSSKTAEDSISRLRSPRELSKSSRQALVTSCAEISDMQAIEFGQPSCQCAIGVRWWHPKQGTDETTARDGVSVGRRNVGSIGPNNPTQGVPTAPAICKSPESMPINTSS